MDINIQNAKIDLIQWVTTLEDSSVIEKLLNIRKEQTEDWQNELSKAEIESIQLGLTDGEKGNVKPHTEAKKIYEKWL